MVEEDCSDIVQVTIECEQASPCLIRPHLDLVVVAARYEEWLCLVKVNATDWAIMFLKSINQCSHTVVP
jgi:hypothetical protein